MKSEMQRCSTRLPTQSSPCGFSTWFGPLIPVPKQGNYWVFYVDERYQTALVGTPDRKYLWLLARTPTIPQQKYTALLTRAEKLGFDISRIIKDPRR